MAWNWLDIIVILLTVGQIGLVVAIGVIVGRIKNGPVSRFSSAVGRNIASGKKLLETGTNAGRISLPHLVRTRDALVRIPQSFRPVVLTDASISYASVRQPLILLTTLRGLRAKRQKNAPSPGVAERMGLIPPVWSKITPYLGYAGAALAVMQEVQKQLPEIKRVLSERDSA
ncbi:MAG: hypothetical protein H8F28_02400 [Fibrella sp.]|nr:hypothetical protein [Armatimonadota bacterium]